MAYALKMFGNKKASFQRYETVNRDVEGINYDLLNEDRKELGKEPLPYKTEFKKSL